MRISRSFGDHIKDNHYSTQAIVECVKRTKRRLHVVMNIDPGGWVISESRAKIFVGLGDWRE